jgi:GNAT superfamily N-acetyltransferase
VIVERATAEDVAEVVRIINAAYDRGEAGIWQPGWRRTEREPVEQEVAAGEIVVARDGGGVVGSVRVRRIADDTAEFGLLAVDGGALGRGVGRALIAYAERIFPVASMELELLVPHAPHAHKQRLHEWYSRLGYREYRRRDFAAVYVAELLAGPADLVSYRKTLR